MLPKLMYISQGKTVEEHKANINNALEAGVKFIQLRLKNVSEEEYTRVANDVKKLCENYHALLVINDNYKVAAKIDADAVHVGLNDSPVVHVRATVQNKIIGGTANTFDDVKLRCSEMVDYIGLGPYRFTGTKEKLSPILNLEGYENIITKMNAEHLNTPLYAIGGIELGDVQDLINAGVYGIAISGAITNASNKKNYVESLNKILYHV